MAAGCEVIINPLSCQKPRTSIRRFNFPYNCNSHKSVKLPFYALNQPTYNLSLQSCLSSSSSPSPSSSSSCSSFIESPPEGYRRNVGICLINPSRKIFAATKIYIPGSWQMPQGGTDEGENPRNAAIRELREETGVTSAEILAEVPYWLTYDFPPDVKAKVNRRWGSRWKGQAQKWFLFKFTGTEEEINLLGDGSEKPEFEKWRWMSPKQVFDYAVDFKKPVYRQVFKFFGPYLIVENERNLFR